MNFLGISGKWTRDHDLLIGWAFSWAVHQDSFQNNTVILFSPPNKIFQDLILRCNAPHHPAPFILCFALPCVSHCPLSCLAGAEELSVE